jgi:hypothetical protein
MGQRARLQRADEHDLQQDVDHRAHEDCDDDRPRQVPLRVLDLAGELVGLLEAEIGEHDAGRGDRREHGLGSERQEAAVRVEVAAVEVGEQQDDRQHRDRDLPPGDGGVDLVEQAHGQEVDPREERHQGDAEPESGPGDLACRRVEDAVPVVGEVLHHGEALDRRHRDRLHPGEEAE